MAASTSAPIDWLSKMRLQMRQQFLDGTNCDMIVKVQSDAPAAKRAKQGKGKGKKKQQQEEGLVAEISAHSLVLSSRSDYFTNALRACAPGGQTKTVELTLPEQATADDLRLLFKLSYGTTYVRDNDALLDKPTRLRLALLAQTFAFDDCVSEVIVSLGAHLSLKGALTLLDDLPEGMREHPSVPELKEKVVKVLATGIDALAGKAVEGEAAETQKKQQLQEAGEALAKALGPVHNLFEEGVAQFTCPSGSFYEALPIKPFVKNLTVAAMGALLGSDKLQMAAEEEAYYLLGAYLHQCNHVTVANRTARFKALVKNIRFHHISSDYLANVVTCCPLAIDSGLMAFFMRSALVYRDVNKELAEQDKVKLGAARRGTGHEEWSLKGNFLLADVMKMGKLGLLARFIGVAGGYPVAVQLQRGEKDTLGAFIFGHMPSLSGATLDGGPERRVGFRCNVQFASEENSLVLFFSYNSGQGYSDWFQKPWDEIVCENSEKNTNNELLVKLTMKKVKK